MNKRVRLIEDEAGSNATESENDYREEDISDVEDQRKRRRRNKKNVQKMPTIIDDTWLPSTMKKLRACNYCKLVLNQEKWGKLKQCPNCPESLAGLDETTDNFESLISLVLPMKSWVAEWQQMKNLIPGIYALGIRKSYSD
ncbi:UNKNOWN [Stylonychia lemnae]|uniref:Spt4/RpoE2 zinc finger domain-containing protein n=1 Tax=Stylonychia lemnae TaxID=5949 RepID=A0A077ZPL8_STYLE|nr:UNKNOWN [Stylonychia lemnae]|eukprot:CDW71838.1 UNKNOWN [Stylonychia lemnae]